MEEKKHGAFLEFNYRNIPIEEDKLEMIDKLDPESVVVDEFWSKSGVDCEYSVPEELATWIKVMSSSTPKGTSRSAWPHGRSPRSVSSPSSRIPVADGEGSKTVDIQGEA